MQHVKFLLSGVSGILLVGCATLLSGTDQVVQITTICRGIPMPTTCVASNDKGRWNFQTPNAVQIKKSAGDLTITCEGGLVGNYAFKAISSANLPMWGNIIAGGAVGAVVDMHNSTAFEYPARMVLEPAICKFV